MPSSFLYNFFWKTFAFVSINAINFIFLNYTRKFTYFYFISFPFRWCAHMCLNTHLMCLHRVATEEVIQPFKSTYMCLLIILRYRVHAPHSNTLTYDVEIYVGRIICTSCSYSVLFQHVTAATTTITTTAYLCTYCVF